MFYSQEAEDRENDTRIALKEKREGEASNMRCENRFRNKDGYEVQCEKEASLVVDTGTKSAFLICVGCKNKQKVHKSRLAPLPAIETDAKIEAVRSLVRAALAALSQKVHKSRLAPLPAIETDAKIEAVRSLVRAALAALSQKTTHQADIDYAKSLCRQALEDD